MGWWSQQFVRADPWPLLLAAGLLMLAYWLWYADPRVAMVAFSYRDDFFYGILLFGAIAAARVVQLLVAVHYAAIHGVSLNEVRSRRRFWPWFAAIIAVTLNVVRAEWPMQAGFHLSRPSFDRLADEALANPANAHRLAGRWAGPYRVAGVEVIDKTVVFYLDRPEGRFGFARVPGARKDLIRNWPDARDDPANHPAFPPGDSGHDVVGQRMAGDWFVVYSSYWSVKVGWS